MEAKKSTVSRVFKVILNILMYIFFAVCLFALIVSIGAKKDADGAMNIFGTQMRIVVSDSMEKSEHTDVSDYKIKDIPVKSLLFIDLVPKDEAKAEKWYSELQVGDVLTFKYVYVRQETITHRITSITPKDGGGYIIELEGDNKASNANTLTQVIDTSAKDSSDYVIGKVKASSLLAGSFITALKTPVGLVCIIIIPSFIIMVLEIIRLVNALGSKKRTNELEALQRRIAELEGGNQAKDTNENNKENDDTK